MTDRVKSLVKDIGIASIISPVTVFGLRSVAHSPAVDSYLGGIANQSTLFVSSAFALFAFLTGCVFFLGNSAEKEPLNVFKGSLGLDELYSIFYDSAVILLALGFIGALFPSASKLVFGAVLISGWTLIVARMYRCLNALVIVVKARGREFDQGGALLLRAIEEDEEKETLLHH